MKKIISIIVIAIALIAIVVGIRNNVFQFNTGNDSENIIVTEAAIQEVTATQSGDYKYIDVSDLVIGEDKVFNVVDAPAIPSDTNLDLKVSELKLYMKVTDELLHGLSNNDILHFTTKPYFNLETDYLASVCLEIVNNDADTHKWGMSSGRIYTFDEALGFYDQNDYGKFIAAEKISGDGGTDKGECILKPGQSIVVRCIFNVKKVYFDNLESDNESVYFVPCSTRMQQFKGNSEKYKGYLNFVKLDYTWGN